MTDKEVMQQALEALEGVYLSLQLPDLLKVVGPITALREALEQPKQEPVAWQYKTAEAGIFVSDQLPQDVQVWQDIEWSIPLYTTPPQRKPLTMDEIGQAWAVADGEHNASASVKRRITRAIEAAHGIKEKP
jgi:hypothetical protein